jgi:5-(carboxyamino)imidazole ribonucleotide synthase
MAPCDAARAVPRITHSCRKALRGGFDGRGVQILRDPSALDKAWPGETLFEKYAGDFREIAVLAVRGRDGEISHFGPVDMTFEQDYAVLDTVIAPADIIPDTERTAIDLAYRAVEALNGVGVFGVEMFLLGDGQVLINEISPRVHNAGHYTLEACASSQFEQHLRAVTGMPLSNDSTQRSIGGDAQPPGDAGTARRRPARCPPGAHRTSTAAACTGTARAPHA